MPTCIHYEPLVDLGGAPVGVIAPIFEKNTAKVPLCPPSLKCGAPILLLSPLALKQPVSAPVTSTACRIYIEKYVK